ncbi:hypothetical protein D3C76_1142520 [compost metagenome]
MRVDPCTQGESLKRATQGVIAPHPQHMPRHITVERCAVQAGVDIVERLGLGIGVTRQHLQALNDFTADLGFETLGANLAGIDVAVAVGRRAGRVVVSLRLVLLDRAEQVEGAVQSTVVPGALDPQLIALAHERLERSTVF